MVDLKENKDKLFRLMAIWGEMTPGERPTPEKMEGYYRIAVLCSFTFEQIEKRGNLSIKRNGYFPKVDELFNDEQDLELRAQEDYAFLKGLCQNLLFAEFATCGTGIIKMKLKEAKKEYLIPMFDIWGAEIAYDGNPTATRAQFLRAYKAEMIRLENDRLLDNGADRKEIDKRATKMIDSICEDNNFGNTKKQ